MDVIFFISLSLSPSLFLALSLSLATYGVRSIYQIYNVSSIFYKKNVGPTDFLLLVEYPPGIFPVGNFTLLAKFIFIKPLKSIGIFYSCLRP